MEGQLKAARLVCGWSQWQAVTRLEALGLQRGVSVPSRESLKTSLSRWENGHVQPHEPYRSLLIELYGVPAEELGLPVDAVIGIPLPRDGLGPTELTPESVELMRTLLGEYALADNSLGPAHLLHVVTQHVVRLEPMLLKVRNDLRADGLRLCSDFAELAGWLCQDAGKLEAAQHWTDRALDFAEELGDPSTRSYVLMRKSGIAADRNDRGRSVTLALASGRKLEELPSTVRALSLRQQAISFALAGDARASVRAASRAVDESGSLTVASPYGYVTPSYVLMEAGVSAYYLGRFDQAADHLGSAAARWPDAFHRDHGLCLARLAVAEAARGNVDVACSVGRDAIAVAEAAPSARTRSRMISLDKRLAPYDRTAFVSEFRQELAAFR